MNILDLSSSRVHLRVEFVLPVLKLQVEFALAQVLRGARVCERALERRGAIAHRHQLLLRSVHPRTRRVQQCGCPRDPSGNGGAVYGTR